MRRNSQNVWNNVWWDARQAKNKSFWETENKPPLSQHTTPWESFQAVAWGEGSRQSQVGFLSWDGREDSGGTRRWEFTGQGRTGKSCSEETSRDLGGAPLQHSATCWPAWAYEVAQNWVKNHLKELDEKAPHTGPGIAPGFHPLGCEKTHSSWDIDREIRRLLRP